MLAVPRPLAAINAKADLALAGARGDRVSDPQGFHQPAEPSPDVGRRLPPSQEGIEAADRLELRLEETSVIDQRRNRLRSIPKSAGKPFQLQSRP